MIRGDDGVAAKAQVLRKTMSPAEVALWMALRQRPAGLKFRRQHPAGPYVADFYCHAAKLIVEVDGQAHDFGDRPLRDLRRDRWFAERGFLVARLPAKDVFADCDAAVRYVVAVASERVGMNNE